MTKAELKIIIDQLVELGEDQEELAYWLDVYDDLPEETQEELSTNLTAELKKLTSIEKRFASKTE